MMLYKKLGVFTLLILVPTLGFTGEFNIAGGLSTEASVQTVNDKTNNTDIDANNLIVRPFLSIVYDSRDLDLLATARHNHVRRSLEDASVTNDFTDFTYIGNYKIVENLLSINARGAQSYRSRAANSFLVDNFLLNAENLSKNTNNGASIRLTLPTGRYFGVNAQVGVGRTTSEAPRNQQLGLIEQQDFSADNYNGVLQLDSGRDLLPFTYNINGSIRGIERRERQNFESQLVNLRLGTNVSSNVSLRLLGYYENNNIENSGVENSSAQALREFYSYGAGIAWQPSNNRFIELGLNRSTTKGAFGQADEEDDFLSLDLQWNFSSRTSLRGNYSRRFFGDSGNFSFSHKLRNWRSSISYNETVTSNSQLLFNQEEGLLVCTNGSTDLADCSLSEGLDTSELGPNEILVPFTENSFELNDRIILRKTTSAQTVFDLRRTTVSFAVSKSTNEEVEVARQIDTSSARLNASLSLSRQSKISSALLYSDIERSLDGDIQSSIIKQFSISYERELSRGLDASITYNYLDRSGDTIGGGGAGGLQGINGPLTDNRVSAEISYTFGRSR